MGWRKWFFPGKVRPHPESAPATAASKPHRRRSHRVSAFLPVFIYGRSHDEPFVEHAVTLNVSANGGLVALSCEVTPSERFLLVNTQTDEELPCRVARIIKMQAATILVGFEFLRPAPRFWSIEFRS
jgi:PilZ domain